MELRKGAEQKAMVAWKIRRETTVPQAWIARRLHMGSASTVTRGAVAMEREITFQIYDAAGSRPASGSGGGASGLLSFGMPNVRYTRQAFHVRILSD